MKQHTKKNDRNVKREWKLRQNGRPRTSLQTFGYRECDNFAAYLHRQSLRGWHFKEWNFGMVFEPGEPQDIVYDVQVFPKGKEKDTKPESDALDYAEYCEAAGWELIDGKKQFCIFRKCKENAVPIVTEEEKFHNVCRAEWRQWLGLLCGEAILLVCFLYTYLFSSNARMFLYIDAIMFAVCVVAARFFWRILDGIWLGIWVSRQKRRLTTGEKIRYDKAGPQKGILVYLREILLGAILLLLLWRFGQGRLAIPVIIVVIIGYAAKIIYEWIRPDRGEVWIGQAAMTWGILTLVVFFLAAFSVSTDNAADKWKTDEVPLVQSDYKEIQGKCSVRDYYCQKGFLGEMETCQVYSNFPKPDLLTYEIYESDLAWVMAHTWNILMRMAEKSGDKDAAQTDCTAQWDAIEAKLINRAVYYVRYEDAVWLIRCGELSEEQVQIVKEKIAAF